MSRQHTPGPWVVAGRELHDRPTQFDEAGARIGSTPNSIAEVHVMPFGNEEANARLIAAAPELLEALKALLFWGWEHTSPRDPNGPHLLLVSAAEIIAKAAGVAP